MAPATGAIAIFETSDDAKKAGHTVKLTEPEAQYLSRFRGKNRKQRMAELKKLRSKGRVVL